MATDPSLTPTNIIPPPVAPPAPVSPSTPLSNPTCQPANGQPELGNRAWNCPPPESVFYLSSRAIPWRQIDAAISLKRITPKLSFAAISNKVFGNTQRASCIRFWFNRVNNGTSRSLPHQTAPTHVIQWGYQLCARCGRVMVEGDSAVIPFYRASFYAVIAHPESKSCPAKAVPGWQAVRSAKMKPLGQMTTDDWALQAKAVEVYQHDKLAGRKRREDKGSENSREGVFVGHGPTRTNVGWQRREALENVLIEHLDAKSRGVDVLDVLAEVIWAERRKTYATFRVVETVPRRK